MAGRRDERYNVAEVLNGHQTGTERTNKAPTPLDIGPNRRWHGGRTTRNGQHNNILLLSVGKDLIVLIV
jgi:hypothetical protein